jgi:hypothetical protein
MKDKDWKFDEENETETETVDETISKNNITS